MDTTGNSLIIGTGSNKWLFRTYTSASFLQLRSFAIGGTWSNTLFGLDCYGNVSFTGNLTCNNTYSNTFYLDDVLTNKPMQLFGYGNNIYVCTSNSNSTGAIYFRNQTISPFTYNHFANFSQGVSAINSSLVLNNALTCTNLPCNSV